MNKIIQKIKYKYNALLFNFFCTIMSDKKLIDTHFIFESEGDYTDNARALSDYILKHRTSDSTTSYWVVSNKNNFKNRKNEKFFRSSSWNPISIFLKSYVFSTSKYVFFTHPWYYNKKNANQVVVNLWHGTTFKNTTSSIGDTYDYMICPSEGVSNWLSQFTGTAKNKMIYCGYPRNDYLFQNNTDCKKILPKKAAKIVLCLPTYHQTLDRNDSEKHNTYIIPYVNSEKELKNLNNFLIKNQTLLIVKPHHLQKINYTNNHSYANIVFIQDQDLVTNNIQLYELLSVSDGLLTDVSSVYFDYLLLDRQIGFFMEDVEEYEKNVDT